MSEYAGANGLKIHYSCRLTATRLTLPIYLTGLPKPYPARELEVYLLSTTFNYVNAEGAELIKAIGERYLLGRLADRLER